MAKAIALLSGGLDSTLAVKLMLDAGVEITALNFTSAFCTCNSGGKSEGGCKSEARKVAEKFGIPIKTLVKGLDYMEVVRNPEHGYGKGINPCVDCRIYMFRRAKALMEELDADFIITGEVLGQRPMSQHRKAMSMIERESGLEGRILRPLCAKHLDPTIPEKEGLVDRQKLLDIEGRARRPQLELAESLDIKDYPCPSGGCLLTDKIFSKKVRDLLDHKSELTITDLQALKIGRHLRYNGVKVIIARNEAENARLASFAAPGDTVLEPANFPGPMAIICGPVRNGEVEMAGRVIVRYSAKHKEAEGPDGPVIKATLNGSVSTFKPGPPVDEPELERMLVC